MEQIAVSSGEQLLHWYIAVTLENILPVTNLCHNIWRTNKQKQSVYIHLYIDIGKFHFL